MPKFIHTADIHLGSRMGARLSREKADERRTEICGTFSRMVDYAKENGVRAILLSGDVFDGDCPFKRDKEFFYSVVRNAPHIDFLYLRGNHDTAEEGNAELPNLHFFGTSFTRYDYDGVSVYGAEFSPENATSLPSMLQTDPERCNIVMLHGQVGDTAGMYQIRLADYAGRGADYLALGHVHAPATYPVDRRCRAAYCGCLEGRGFDECGKRGFVLLEADEHGVRDTFVPFAARTVVESSLSVSGMDGIPAVLASAERACPSPRDLFRLHLTGEADFATDGMAELVANRLSTRVYCVSVKDETTRKFDAAAYQNDVSLRGEVFRCLQNDPTLSPADRDRVMEEVLRALAGEEAGI